MNTNVEKLSETRVKLTVNVPFSELDKEIEQAYVAIAQQVNIPGFRRGKAPRQLIDARLGRGAILEQVVNDMLPSRYEQAVMENDLKVVGQPEIDITKVEDKDFVEFTAEMDIRPEIEVPDFADISVTVPAIAVDDKAVDEELEKLAARFSETKDTKRKMKTGDLAIIDIVAEVDGKKVEEASTEGLSYQIGDDNLIKGLDTALRGLKTGEDNEFTTEMLTGEHKGKEATIKVHVVQTKERKLPELDDEFAQMASEFDTIAELREDTKAQVEENKKAEQAAAIRDEVLKAALEKVSFGLPQSIVDEQVHNQLHQILGQLAHDEKAFAQLLEAQGTNREEFDKETRANAEDNVRTQMFLDAVADKEQPEVSQQELMDHVMFTASSYGMDPNHFIQQIQSNGQMGNLFADVRRGKALAVSICRVEAKDENGNVIDVDQYFGEIEEEADTDSED
ncbi:trigger factor [Corynebacterium phocae]|uniref:Trigger factor n=1 Tax=Corynebacterium phocae TaxID=161895 RepID=A0A1L7D1V7_9CORY|nr:trigger factor [Corynebacterium phocae]APT92057.1 trigger factor [Corynebacterium phocae]KAA8726440.1 trigger factor [Corynebacterium phocae]